MISFALPRRGVLAPDEQMTKEQKEFARGLIANKGFREAPNDQRKRERLFRLLDEETEKHDLEDFKVRCVRTG